MSGSMHLFVTELRDFYHTPLGTVARRLIRRQIRNIWPDARDLQIVGLGYATPYLLSFHHRMPVAALMPAHQGVTLWPPEGPYKAALIDEKNLPLADSSVDRLLVVHALEMSEHGTKMLREAWRVLKPEGQLLLIVPNRRGLWAGPESTPFGHGRPLLANPARKTARRGQFHTAKVASRFVHAALTPLLDCSLRYCLRTIWRQSLACLCRRPHCQCPQTDLQRPAEKGKSQYSGQIGARAQRHQFTRALERIAFTRSQKQL